MSAGQKFLEGSDFKGEWNPKQTQRNENEGPLAAHSWLRPEFNLSNRKVRGDA